MGKSQAESAGKALKAKGLVPEIILTSPLLRARQTAEGVLRGACAEVTVKALDLLSPGAHSDLLAEEVKRLGSLRRILLVGHQPDLGNFVSYLVSGDDLGQIGIEPGGMMFVESEDLSPGSGTRRDL